MAVQFAAETEVAPQDRFDYYWNQRGEWVEEPNVRRGGESGVQRVVGRDGQLLYAKRQTGHIYRSWLHPFGRPTVLRELDALTGVSRLGVRVPQIVFCGAQVASAHEDVQSRELRHHLRQHRFALAGRDRRNRARQNILQVARSPFDPHFGNGRRAAMRGILPEDIRARWRNLKFRFFNM